MKQLHFLLVALVLSTTMSAQITVKPGSFREVEGFINNSRDKQSDDNDVPYSVLKIKTENINDKQRHELFFEGDAATGIECEYKTGEVWVYLTHMATYIKISHPDLSSTEFHFPFDMKPQYGYEITLVNNAVQICRGWGSLVVKTKPEVGAEITINGIKLKHKTPYENEMIPAGIYEVTVSEDGVSNTVSVRVNEQEAKMVEIKAPYNVRMYYDIVINTDRSDGNDMVYIDGESVGFSPVRKTLSVGKHHIKITRKIDRGYAVVEKQITVSHTDNTEFFFNIGKELSRISLNNVVL